MSAVLRNRALLGAKLRLMEDEGSKVLELKSTELAQSNFPDAALRHRLWLRSSSALQVPNDPPLSTRSASQAASALAVRAELQGLELMIKAAQLAPYDLDVLSQRSNLDAHRHEKPGLNSAIYDLGNEALSHIRSKRFKT